MQQKKNGVVLTRTLQALFEANRQQYRILYFVGPCGAGKTTAAQQLLARAGGRLCTLSAEAPGLPARLAGADGDEFLIDDFQHLNDPQDQQAFCAYLNAHPTTRFVLLSRGALPGWLMPYRFTGLLTTINTEALFLDRAAVHTLAAANGATLSEREMSALLADTLGYPIMVSLICRQLGTGQPYSATVLEQAKAELFRYLEEAVYHRFSPSMRALLLALAPFESFDAELAKLVSGDSHVNDLLAKILHETTMLKTTGLNDYRFWALFREFLLWEMEQDCTAEKQRDIYRRAGLYYELHDDYARALDCYTRCGAHDKISELLVKNAENHAGVAHYYEMEQYYYALTREEVLRSPVLMCGMSMLTSLCLDYEASEGWYTELQNYAARLNKTDANYKIAKSKLIYLDIALPQRGSKGLLELIGTVFRAMTDKQLEIPQFSVTSTLPSVMNGGKDFCEWSKKDDLLYATMRLPIETVLGRDGIGLADCALCESKFEKGEDVSSRLLVLMARMSDIQRKGTPDIEFAVVGLLVRTQVAQGKATAALDTLNALRESFAERGQTRFLPNLDAMRCRIWLRLGEADKADAWLRESAPATVPHFRAMWRYRYMTKAMCLLADDKPDETLLCLAPLLPYCEHCARVMDSLQLRLLMAICHYRQKDKTWKTELETALDTAWEYRFIQPVAQYGAAVLPLLNACGWKKDPAFYEKLLAATRVQTVHYPDFLRPPVTLAEPLSPAETQVLKLLCHNRSNQEIADILGVKLATVKTQVRSILQKLGVTRRSEAKDAAQTLHLL